jgi:hypothetical protein
MSQLGTSATLLQWAVKPNRHRCANAGIAKIFFPSSRFPLAFSK